MPEEILDPAVPTESAPAPAPEALGGAREALPTIENESGAETRHEPKSERFAQILSKVKTHGSATTDDEVTTDAESIGAAEAAEQKVHKLIELAQVKGVAHAVRVAKRMNDLYVLDTMHDEMADQLYEGLLTKGLIDKE